MNAPASFSNSELTRRVDAIKQRVSLSTLVGRAVKLRKRGNEWVGLCPFHQENSPSFTVNEDKGFYHCFGCGAHGDVIRFMTDHNGLQFLDALAQLEGDAGLAQESTARRDSVREPERANPYIEGLRAAAIVWQMAGPARGELPEAWLRARGIDPMANGTLDVVRYLARCPVGLWRKEQNPRLIDRTCEAMITPFLRVRGERGAREISLAGVHVTYLSPDGRSKADLGGYRDGNGKWHERSPRVMWGTSKRGAVIIPARPVASLLEGNSAPDALKQELIRLIDDRAGGSCVVGEGLESTQSLMARVADARMGCATLSLGNLQGVEARTGKHGAIPLWNPTGDPASPPFTIEQPGKVVIGIDADMKELKSRWVQERRGAFPVKRDLPGAERADLCGKLAAWHWRAAGSTRVDVVRPPMGADFNDLDQAGVGA